MGLRSLPRRPVRASRNRPFCPDFTRLFRLFPDPHGLHQRRFAPAEPAKAPIGGSRGGALALDPSVWVQIEYNGTFDLGSPDVSPSLAAPRRRKALLPLQKRRPR